MRGPGRLLLLALTVHALPEVPRSNSTLNLTCFGWRLVPPELILTHEGAYLHGVAINESELQAIRHVTADLVVVDDFWLKDLSSLANLERVGGNVEIRYTMRLENISGLSNLEVIGGSLNIFFNRGLKHIEGFTKLQVVGRALRVNHNDLLESITGFPKLVRIGQDFTLRGNGQLLAAPSMPSLRAIGGDVEVIFNSIQTMDHMVSALESIDGNFLIKDNDNLTNLTLLPNVTKIGKTFELSFNHGITELHGPPQLHQLGALTIKSNPSLKIVDGFDSLRSLCCEKDFKKDDVPGDFAVMFNTQLLDMSFPELQAVRDFTVIDNDNLTEAWFPSLWSVAGDVQVSYNAQLRSFRSATSAADSVSFLANFQLTEVAMPNLSRVLKGGMAISFNMELEYLNNFSALRQVSGDLQIKGNRRLKDIRTFEELRQVTGNVLVENNTDLTDISGLSSALVVGGNLELSKNDQLQRISGLESLPKVLGFSVWSINCSGNAVHPMNATRCESCTQWEMPSVDGRRCLLNWSFILVVGVTYAFAFCLASVVCMTLRTAMVVDAIIISSNGRILLRATERHYLLRGFWGRSFPIYVQGTGCDFLDRQEPIRARAVSDVELELLVRVEKFNRRTLSSLPLSEVSFQRTVDSAMGFNKTDGSCVLSCEGFAVLRSPWELLTVGLCMPSLVWALGFALAIGGLVVLCSSLDPAMPWDFLLLNAAQSASLGSALALLLRLLAVLRRRRQRRKRRVELREVQLMGQLEQASWDGDEAAILAVHKELAERGWSQQRLKANLRELRCKQSQEAGVSVAYLLSSEFFQLSEARSGKDDPDFYDLKDAFFLQGEPIGGEEICPRDGRRGCAMVDVLRREHRRQCTHFLSWAWCYQVSVVRSAMRSWMDQSKLEPSKTFLYMCFFVNNQYRILLDQQGAGSRDFSLGEVFEENLQRVGRMVALLDHWDQPSYLSRIWTIFEQYSAVVLEIEVTFILPQASGESLLQEIRKGEQGILAVRESLCTVDAETASAWCLEDERHVKRVIEQSIGFEKVNEKVQELMIAWVATMVKDYLGNLVVLGTRRLQRQRARTLLSVPASTEVTNKLSSRTEVSVGTMQTIRVKHTDSIWSQYMQNESTTH